LDEILSFEKKLIIPITIQMFEPAVAVLLRLVDPELFPALDDYSLVKITANSYDEDFILLLLGDPCLQLDH
jgi:hypothetical protein